MLSGYVICVSCGDDGNLEGGRGRLV